MPLGGQRTTNTMQEFVPKMLHLISDAKASPDIDDQRDLPFLVDLETSILQYVRQPLQAAGAPDGSGVPGMSPDAGQGAPPMPPPGPDQGMPPGGPPMQPAPQGPGGVSPGIPTDNMVQELRRSIG